MSHIRSKETLLIAKDFFDEDEQNKDEKTNIVVSDDGDGLTENAEELVSNVYNIQNSSDVIFGPVTQITGPVTIYQCGTTQEIFRRVNCKTGAQTELDKDNFFKSPTTSILAVERCPILHWLLKPHHVPDKFTCKLLPLFILLLTITITVILTVLVTRLFLISRPTEKIYGTSLSTHRLIYRNEWGGQLPTSTITNLKHPVLNVVVSHSESGFCTSVEDCSEVVRDLQYHHVAILKSEDIGYNFLIGGDANIYVGRGWDLESYRKDSNFAFCFIGNFQSDLLLPDMIEAGQMLLAQGVEMGKLAKNYKLLAHNHTMDSPGENVYRIIKESMHFDRS